MLRRLFPSSSSSTSLQASGIKRPPIFDPTQECVATLAQQKKIKAIRCKVTVIPKGKGRKALKEDGYEQTIEVKRNMSGDQIKAKILNEFFISRYLMLTTTQAGTLVVAKDRLPDGKQVIETTVRKFPMYICEAKVRSCIILCIYISTMQCYLRLSILHVKVSG